MWPHTHNPRMAERIRLFYDSKIGDMRGICNPYRAIF